MLLALTIDPIPGFPDVPTFKKVYKKDMVNTTGMMAPAGVPPQILGKLENAVYEGTKSPEFTKTMETMSMTPWWRTSKELTEDVETAQTNLQEFLKDLDLLKKK